MARHANIGFTFQEHHLETLGRFCREQNPRFLMDRWIDYIAGECGPNGGTIRKGETTNA